MLTFHNDPAIKEKYIARLKAHAAADEIIKGQYWEYGKGCAVGCTIHGNDHYKYETELGIPMVFAKLKDRIFELLPNPEAKEFPLRFLYAVPVGVDLQAKMVIDKFLLWILANETHDVLQYAGNEKTSNAVEKVIDLYQRKINGELIGQRMWEEAANAAFATYATAAFYAAAYATCTAKAAHKAAAAYAADAYAFTAYSAAAQADKLISLFTQCV